VFNLSGSEIIFLILIALVVLGPDKLPDAMRKAGKAYGDFKRMTSGFQSEMKSVLDEPMRELRETADLAKSSAMFDTSSFTKPLSGLMADVKSATSGSSATPVKPAETPDKPAEPAASAPETAPVAEAAASAEPASVEPAAEFIAVADAQPADSATVAPAAEFVAAPAISPPGGGDATSRRLARMRQPSLGGTPSVDPSPAEGAAVE
jgi:sec-independent protein translocase protein TatB